MTRVLLVDDEENNRRVLRLPLLHAGYAIFEADSAKRALEVALSATPDVVVMDIELHGPDGIDAAQSILAAVTPKPAIFALSAHNVEDIQARCRAVGMCDFIVKPAKHKIVTAAIERARVGGQWLLLFGQFDEAVIRQALEHAGPHVWPREVRSLAEARVLQALGIVAKVCVPESMVDDASDLPLLRLATNTVTAEAANAFMFAEVDALIVDLVDPYLVDVAQRISATRTAMSKGDLLTAQRLGHDLKGNARSFGLPRLGLLGATLERVARQGLAAAAQAVLTDVEGEQRAAVIAWRKHAG